MKRNTWWLVMPLALAFAACGGDAEEEPMESAEETTPPAATEPGGATATSQPPMMSGMSMSAPMQALGNSGVSGEASVTDRGAQTEVMVRLTGAPPSGSHPGHIHSGTCEAVGGVVAPLQQITVDSSGTGTATSTVDVPAATAMDGRHVIVYHGAGGTPAACAPIPAHRM